MSGHDRILYEIAGRDDRRPSPFCWRVRMALAHKGLECHFEPTRYTDKEKIAFSGQKLLPILVDFGEVITDSWSIAKYIDENYYQERSLLMGGGTRFVSLWTDTQLQPILARCIIKDIYDNLDPADQEYFRASREARYGKSIEEMHLEREANELNLKRVLGMIRELVRTQPFICGKAPAYADYIVFGAFQWARCVSPFKFLDDNDPIYAWRGRMIRQYGSIANSVPHFY
ncbi:MAG TPA: glutathione S-transferase family protein [Burkholderiales bacterium]|jgi:glutathione S-transferase